jgi:WD40 repeat protein
MADRVGQQLGNYRLLRLLGQGGFAEVYLGEHIYLGTEAALKLLHTQLAGEETDTFRKEARTVARLVHPHIVRVFDFGIERETPFLVMDYAPGGTVRRQHPKGATIPLPTILSYLKQVADALQYAHDEHFVHRDIKPENLLVGRRQEILLSDFGIALLAQTSRSQSMQDVAGTASYMAPEQFQGKPRPASDQYALAVMVYEWLTGACPFHGSFTEVASQHLFMPPPPLQGRTPAISPEVEQVVMTALAKDPRQRFGSVQAFATAFEQASQVEPTETILASHPSQATELASAPDESLIPTELVTPPGQSALAPTEYAPFSPPAPALPPTVYAQPFPPASTLPPTQRASVSPPAGTILFTYRGHSKSATAVAWSPDRTRIASASADKTVQIWNAATGQILFTYRSHSESVTAVAWSPDGTRITSGSQDKTVQVWDAATGETFLTYYGHSGLLNSVISVAWSPDGTRIASASTGLTGHVQVWDAVDGGHAFNYPGYTGAMPRVAWSPDSTRIVLGSGDEKVGLVQVWDAADGEPILQPDRPLPSRVTAVAWSPDGKRIASASVDIRRLNVLMTKEEKVVQVWDAATGKILSTYWNHARTVTAVAWSPDSTRLASGSEDLTVQVWDAATSDLFLTYDHSKSVTAVAWSSDSTRIASASADKTVQVWQAS